MWFSPKDLKKCETIRVDDLHGYVLPHAGTKYTGDILSHTLRFKPRKRFTTVAILYYPVAKTPNIKGQYYHEFFVPWKTLKHVFSAFWDITRDIEFVGVNVRDKNAAALNKIKSAGLSDTLFVVSADFSHHLPLQEALRLENCSAYGLMQRDFSNLECMDVVDKVDTFSLFYRLVPPSWMLQWMGRTQSGGKKGVGYLSFLLREKPVPEKNPPDSVFITALDGKMRQRECLGKWYSAERPWTEESEKALLNKVVREGSTTSRLLPGATEPVSHYTVTYLYEDPSPPFIRGWHGIRAGAFYLPDVLLEHTFNNGTWITRKDRVWKHGGAPPEERCPCKGMPTFSLKETLEKLQVKSGRRGRRPYTQYRAHVFHNTVKSFCEVCGAFCEVCFEGFRS